MNRVRVRRHVRRRARRSKESPLARERLAKGELVTEGGIKVFTKRPGMGGSQMAPDILPEGKGAIMIGEDTLRESAASTLDDLLGFGVVPPTVLRVSGDPRAMRPHGISVQLLMDAMALDEWTDEGDNPLTREEAEAWRSDFIKIAVFDLIVGARDRHLGNVLITETRKRAYAIDNEEIMTGLGPRMFTYSYYQYVEGARLPSGVLRALAELTEGDFFAAFAGIDMPTIREAWERKKLLQRRGRLPTYDELEDYGGSVAR